MKDRFRKFLRPNGEEWAAFLKRRDVLYAMGGQSSMHREKFVWS